MLNMCRSRCRCNDYVPILIYLNSLVPNSKYEGIIISKSTTYQRYTLHIYTAYQMSQSEEKIIQQEKRNVTWESYNVFSSLYLIVLLKPQIFVFKLLSAYLGDQLTSIDLAEMSSVYKSNGSQSS